MFGEEFKSTERKLRSQENKNAWRAQHLSERKNNARRTTVGEKENRYLLDILEETRMPNSKPSNNKQITRSHTVNQVEKTTKSYPTMFPKTRQITNIK